MKKVSVLLFASLILATLFLACDPRGNDPIMAELRLVPLTSGDLEKVVTSEDGNQYFPLSELKPIMLKKASADIDFGNMDATRTLQYVLMNVGNTDVYNITFDAGELRIHPSYIGLVPTSGEGGDLIALPIISITEEHVMPLSGVGALLDMSVGEFTDMMTLSYNYNITDTAGVDSFDITDEYTISGTKMGALIEIQVSGIKLEDALSSTLSRYDLAGFSEPFYDLKIDSGAMDTLIVYNYGNAPLPLRVVNQYVYTNYGGAPILDTLLMAGESINLSGIVRGERFFVGDPDYTRGNIIYFGSNRDQPYIFEILGQLCIDGEEGLLFTEQDR